MRIRVFLGWVTLSWALGCGSSAEPALGTPLPSTGSAGRNDAPGASGGAGTPAAIGGNGGSKSPATSNTGGAGRPAAQGGAGSLAGTAAGAGAPGAGGRAAGGAGAAAISGNGGSPAVATERFSFFITSLEAMRQLSGSQDGFGGDLRHGESSGLAGADKICTEIAERSLSGAGAKGWRAFLSAKAAGPGGAVVHARDRIGAGPWYDRNGRLVAKDLSSLLGTRPGADAAIANDLPNERGEPNHGSQDVDNHDTVTGSDAQGNYAGSVTCEDWTSTQTATTSGSGGRSGGGGGGKGPMCGHSWPAQSGQSWIAAHAAPGCSPSVSLVQNGAGSGTGIGNGGGYGGIYCFALQP